MRDLAERCVRDGRFREALRLAIALQAKDCLLGEDDENNLHPDAVIRQWGESNEELAREANDAAEARVATAEAAAAELRGETSHRQESDFAEYCTLYS
jgi:hypothetical protein